MTAVLELRTTDQRSLPSYAKGLQEHGLIPAEATEVEFLLNSDKPDESDTKKFLENMMRFRPGKTVATIHNEGINADGTSNGLTVFVAYKI